MVSGLIDIRQLDEMYHFYLTEIPRSKKLLCEGLQRYNDMCDGTTKVEMHNAIKDFTQRIKDSETSFEAIKGIRIKFYN
jgi:hypothetical protein